MKLLLLVLTLGVLSSYAQKDGSSLHKQVKNAYASLDTYQDEGVTTVSNSNKTVTIPFRNLSIKPSKVRFEFVLSHPYFPLSFIKTRYAVWCNGTNFYFTRSDKTEKRSSIYGAWGGVHGISRGTSPHISSFLLQRPLGSGVYKGKAWTIVGADRVRGEDCIHVAVKQWKGGDVQVWVSKKDYLIRKIIDDDTLIEYVSILINTPIDEALFMGK